MANVSCKGPESKSFGLPGLYRLHCSYSTLPVKADIDDTKTNGCDCVSVKLYLPKQVAGPQDSSLLILVLSDLLKFLVRSCHSSA